MTFESASTTWNFRETLHSPDRVFDDFEILRLTAEALEAEGVEVELVRPEQISRGWWNRLRPEIAFVMCEQERMLEPLSAWERQGATLINSVRRDSNTYRHRMISVSSAGVRFPRSELVPTRSPHLEDRLRVAFGVQTRVLCGSSAGTFTTPRKETYHSHDPSKRLGRSCWPFDHAV